MTIPPHSGYVEGWPRRSGMPRSVKTFARGGETLPMILPAASPSAREFGLERICDFPIICRAVGALDDRLHALGSWRRGRFNPTSRVVVGTAHVKSLVCLT